MLWVGTSGWQYRHWRERLYPKGVPQRRWLEHYAGRFRTVEVNNTFYHLPSTSTFEGWAERTPDDFVMALKMSGYLTHNHRLRDPEEPIQTFLERARPLGRKMGPILLQLPPRMKADLGLLRAALRLLSSQRVAVEPRHDSWFTDGLRALLEEEGAALCYADSPARSTPLWRTAGFGFVRFHEGEGRPRPCYVPSVLRSRLGQLEEAFHRADDVFCYFNNDGNGCAPRDAAVFARLATEAGLRTTRTPEPEEIVASEADPA
ncbi:MAG TPA: DUF72 domain-containing protein [Candidatus Dormibacteraeota bacterium]|nr:DUF72 domain-containing protein [Candidatus Dormibacteraeota bacterium]